MVKSSDCNCSLYGSSLLINGNELTSMCFVPPTLLLMFSNQSGIEDTTTDFFQYSDQTMSAQFGPAIASKGQFSSNYTVTCTWLGRSLLGIYFLPF